MTDRPGWQFWEKSPRRSVRGGIRAQARRGQSAPNWWEARWIEVLESFQLGTRLARGRSYARLGQVISIDIVPGEVRSLVQGSRAKPYQVVIRRPALTPEQWKSVTSELSKQVIHAAKLMAGEMPQDIEQTFQAAGLSLFPSNLKELETHCSCPDSSNPCKHIAAVYILLGEEFGRDPFLLFKLRGLPRDDLLPMLGVSASSQQEDGAPPPEPLPSSASAFWGMMNLPPDFLGDVRESPKGLPLLRSLGPLPFWRSETPLLEAVEGAYNEAAEGAMGVLAGDSAAFSRNEGRAGSTGKKA